MNTEEWKAVIEIRNGYDLIEYLADNTIEGCGEPSIESWELIFEAIIESGKAFKAGEGTWIDIFNNWYRKDIDSTSGIGRFAASSTNATSDITFFAKNAYIQGLWKHEDYFSLLDKKIMNAGGTTKQTPSKRFLVSAFEIRTRWEHEYVKRMPLNVLKMSAEHGIFDANILSATLANRIKSFSYNNYKENQELPDNTKITNDLACIISTLRHIKIKDMLVNSSDNDVNKKLVSKLITCYATLSKLDTTYNLNITNKDVEAIGPYLQMFKTKNRASLKNWYLDFIQNENSTMSDISTLARHILDSNTLKKLNPEQKTNLLVCALDHLYITKDTDQIVTDSAREICKTLGFGTTVLELIENPDVSMLKLLVKTFLSENEQISQPTIDFAPTF